MVAPARANAVLVILVLQPCKVLSMYNLVTHLLVKRYVEANIHNNVLMVQELVCMNAQAALFLLQHLIGSVLTTSQTTVIKELVVASSGNWLFPVQVPIVSVFSVRSPAMHALQQDYLSMRQYQHPMDTRPKWHLWVIPFGSHSVKTAAVFNLPIQCFPSVITMVLEMKLHQQIPVGSVLTT
jgi:hypothetical protein